MIGSVVTYEGRRWTVVREGCATGWEACPHGPDALGVVPEGETSAALSICIPRGEAVAHGRLPKEPRARVAAPARAGDLVAVEKVSSYVILGQGVRETRTVEVGKVTRTKGGEVVEYVTTEGRRVRRSPRDRGRLWVVEKSRADVRAAWEALAAEGRPWNGSLDDVRDVVRRFLKA